MVRVYTVHGTNAGAPEDRGDQWWQRGSFFQDRLQAYIAERLDFHPFHWSGANSEMARRDAGGDLLKEIRGEAEPPIVIGHSHGGSVAIHALYLAAARKARKGAGDSAAGAMRALLTVGTPMIRYSAAKNPVFRFNIIGQLFLIYALLIAALVSGAIIFGDVVDELTLNELIGTSVLTPFLGGDAADFPVVAKVLTPAVLFASILPIVILYFYARRSSRRNMAFRSNRLAEEFGEAYAPLNHSHDEAIAALRSSAGLKLTIADRNTVRQAIFAPLSLLLAAVLAVSTISEVINTEAARALFNAERAMADRRAHDAGQAEDHDHENEPQALAIRDAASQIAYLSGDRRGKVEEMDRRRLGLTRQTVYLREDYVVFDLATALRKPTKKALLAYIETLPASAPGGVVNFGDGNCQRYALYLTPSGRADLLERARALPDDGPLARARSARKQSPSRRLVQPRDTYGRTLDRLGASREDRIERCRRLGAAYEGSEAPAAELLTPEALLAIADGALLTSRPPVGWGAEELLEDLVLETEAEQALYPELDSGEAIVFERSSFNDAQFACLFARARKPVEAFLFWTDGPSDRLVSLEGFCSQLEGADLTIYDVATPGLSEGENILRNVGDRAGEVVSDLLGRRADDPDRESYLDDDTIQTGVLSPLYFVASVLIIARILASLASVVFAPMLSAIFNRLIKQRIFGNDGYGENVEQVAPGLDFSAKTIGTLPERVEAELAEHVQQFAPETIKRVREIISLDALKADDSLPLTELAESLTWKELIHTSYFDVDGFARHVAWTLVDLAGLTPSRALEEAGRP